MTARVQIAPQGSKIYLILQELNRRGFPPVLLNTSFNLKGEPNVE